MDIPVSRLNHRMALQLPPELPLGLVFVVGQVAQLRRPSPPGGMITLQLREGDYFLECRLTPRASAGQTVRDGDRVRAGGHLAFDPTRAHYYLLARDVEVVGEMRRPAGSGRATLNSILDDVRQRAEATSLVTPDLPPWVRRLAPPEVRAELDLLAKTEWDDSLALPPDEPSPAGQDETPLTDPTATGLTEELFTLLSAAMDSDEDLELTPEILGALSVAERIEPEPVNLEATAVPPVIDEMPTPPAEPEPEPVETATAPPVESGPPAPAAVAESTPATPPAVDPSRDRLRYFEFLLLGLALGVILVLLILGALILLIT